MSETPRRIKHLPVDHRGFPVPWFVQWFRDGEPCGCGEGSPDFRCIDGRKMSIAIKRRRCWICGDPLGVNLAFVIGPMCAINRVISEPPSHSECAEFSALACPFLSRPRMRRNEKGLPASSTEAGGIHITRNPGAVCLWITNNYTPFTPTGGGLLFRLGDPQQVEWYANGRRASRDEVMESINSGLPILEDIARADGQDAMRALRAQVDRGLALVPA